MTAMGYKISSEMAITQEGKLLGEMVIVEGLIFNKAGQLIKDATIQLVIDATLEPLTDEIPLPDGSYAAWTDRNPYTISVIFRAPGYIDQKIQISTLENYPNVTMVPGGNSPAIPIFAILAVVAAIAVYRRKNKVGKIGVDDILPIFLLVAGVLGFSMFKQVMEFLGLWKSADTKELDNLADNPNSFWNPNFWQTVKPANKDWTYAITDTTALAWSKEIYNSFGWLNDNEERVIGVFKRCRTQANASFLAYIFEQYYGQDLLTFLRGGMWPQDRLSDADVNLINRFIKNLPKY